MKYSHINYFNGDEETNLPRKQNRETEKAKNALQTTHEKQKITTEENKKKFLEVLEQNMGIVANACAQVGIGRSTYYHYYSTDVSFKEQVDAIRNVVTDFVEAQLYKNIKSGDIASTIFYLKTQAKDRGYSENNEIKFNSDIQISVVQPKQPKIDIEDIEEEEV